MPRTPDTTSRGWTIARYIGKYIPGNPTVVPQNMTGAGGLRMANYLYEVAPKDGTRDPISRSRYLATCRSAACGMPRPWRIRM